MRYAIISLLLIGFATPTMAADTPEFNLTIKNHLYAPQELTIPANQKVKLIIKNEDDTAAEFESTDLNREKIVTANGQISVYVGPLDPGRYGFFDDFHRDTKGTILAK